jgi:putative ABC transport system permease protein
MEVSMPRWLADARDDVRYSLRSLAQARAFTLSATLVLAIGVGASTAVFSVVDAVLLSPLPYPEDGRLVRIYQQNSAENRWTLSAVDVQAIERHATSISAVGALRMRAVGVGAGGSAERLTAGYINAGWIEALDQRMEAGRPLEVADEDPASQAVVVLSNAYATRTFGSAHAAIHQSVTIDGLSHRVVGVLPRTEMPLGDWSADVWPVMKRVTPTRRGPFGIWSVARLRAGATVEDARRDLAAVSVRIYPEWKAGFQDSLARLTPYRLRDTIVGNAERPLALIVAAVTLVLLIAVSNVASLSFVRATRRWHELSLRAALGASRGRIVRLMITESTLLACGGGALGLVVAWLALASAKQLAIGFPRLRTAEIDALAAAVAFGVVIVAGFIAGAVPALRLLSKGGGAGRAFGEGSRSVSDGVGTSRVRGAFVAAEFALALPVLAAGALLLTSLMHLQRVDPGFAASGLIAMRVSVPAASFTNAAEAASFWTRVSAGVDALPGVTASGFGTALPPSDQGNNNNNFTLVDSPVPPGGAEPTVTWPTVSIGLLRALDVPLIDGRWFTPTDTGGPRPVVVVTEAWARRWFPGRSPIGRQMIGGGCMECPRTTIVGVVGDVTFDELRAPGEAVFSPATEGWPSQLILFARIAAPDAAVPAVAERIRAVIRSADPAAATGPVMRMEQRVHESIAPPRHWAMILSTFAAAALAMAAVGVFGLLSYAVAVRRREIGVRIALGAPPARVVRAMVSGGMRHAAVGTAVGLGLTALSSRWLAASLYDVSGFHLPTVAMVTLGLLLVALVAAWIPARRAASIDPIEAIRPT